MYFLNNLSEIALRSSVCQSDGVSQSSGNGLWGYGRKPSMGYNIHMTEKWFWYVLGFDFAIIVLMIFIDLERMSLR